MDGSFASLISELTVLALTRIFAKSLIFSLALSPLLLELLVSRVLYHFISLLAAPYHESFWFGAGKVLSRFHTGMTSVFCPSYMIGCRNLFFHSFGTGLCMDLQCLLMVVPKIILACHMKYTEFLLY